MKGIVLAAGTGSRMYPTTQAISKQLISVYDKPAIYYPLSILMLMDVKEVAIVVNESDVPLFKKLLGDGSHFGIEIKYFVQDRPKGIPDAFQVTKDYIKDSEVALILGDNFFYGYELPKRLRVAREKLKGATIFVAQVKDPENFGVIVLDSAGRPVEIAEKPKNAKSNLAVTGLYLFNEEVVELSSNLQPSTRGETEIVEVINKYLSQENLNVVHMGRGTAWLDTGTPDGLISCAQFVKSIEDRQALKISCLEEIAFTRRFISKDQFRGLIEEMPSCPYRNYLEKLQAED